VSRTWQELVFFFFFFFFTKGSFVSRILQDWKLMVFHMKEEEAHKSKTVVQNCFSYKQNPVFSVWQ
jgi:hypothetical protein